MCIISISSILLAKPDSALLVKTVPHNFLKSLTMDDLIGKKLCTTFVQLFKTNNNNRYTTNTTTFYGIHWRVGWILVSLCENRKMSCFSCMMA
jgi:hypothetical protein